MQNQLLICKFFAQIHNACIIKNQLSNQIFLFEEFFNDLHLTFYFCSILLHSDNVSIDFSGQDNGVFRGTKQGRIYLTSHRMIFNNKKPGDEMQSFSAPFIAMSDVSFLFLIFYMTYALIIYALIFLYFFFLHGC